jgi:branched-chain amino acid transport system permease protein
MPYAKTSKLEIAYEEAGSGPNVVVFLHGNFGSSRWWQPVLERLPAGFRAIAPVLRGCAGTTGATTGFEITQLSDDLEAFVTCLGIRRFHLVGHSLGGAVATQFALDHPAMLRSMMLVASAPASGLSGMRETGSRTATIVRMFDPDSAPAMSLLELSYRVQSVWGVNRSMLRGALAELMPTFPHEGVMFDGLVDDATRMIPEAVVGYLKALHRFNVERELRRIDVPVLVLAGTKDVLVPRAALERTAQLLPRGELVEWSHVGHSPMLEAPDELARLVVDFSLRQSAAMRVWTWLWIFFMMQLNRRRLLHAEQPDPGTVVATGTKLRTSVALSRRGVAGRDQL